MRILKLLNAIFIAISLVLTFNSFAQTIVSTHPIYGGRINTIVGYADPSSVTDSRIFIATESANTIFYSDVNTPLVGTATFNPFKKVTCADTDDNLGSAVYSMACHRPSKALFFAANNTLYLTLPGGSAPYYSTKKPVVTNVQYVLIKNNTLLYLSGNQLGFGTLDMAGNFTASASSPINITSSGLQNAKIILGSTTDSLYVMAESHSAAPKMYRASNLFTALGSTTTFKEFTPSVSAKSWQAFGVAPDERWFLGGSDGLKKYIAYSDDFGKTWTEFNTNISGVAGPNFDFWQPTLLGSSYRVYFAKCYSTNKGASGSWTEFGTLGQQTHPNDGAVLVVPGSTTLSNVAVCMTTDQGIGKSVDNGATITEMDKGAEAVQVNDFDMTADKKVGWLASKAGNRKVIDFTGTPTWSRAMFPNGDGSPYYSTAIWGYTGDSAFVGNVRVYRTKNSGTDWEQVFSAENAPYNFGFQAQVKALEVYPLNRNLVLAGYSIDGDMRGGLFYSTSGGNSGSWKQIYIKTSTDGQDVDVNDISFTTEGGNPVAYIGVEYSSTAGSYSVYRAEYSGGSWAVTQDMDGAHTSTGSSIIVNIEDVHTSITGDTVVVSGIDAGGLTPVLYYKNIKTTNKWTVAPIPGPADGKRISAITMGFDTLFIAWGVKVYYLKSGSSTWNLLHTYPNGTQINFLYYDELLVGTGTGMDGVMGKGTVVAANQEIIGENDTRFKIYPNPFKTETTVSIDMPNPDNLKISIIDMSGREVQRIDMGRLPQGEQTFSIHTANLSKGTYLCRMTANSTVFIKKIIISE